MNTSPWQNRLFLTLCACAIFLTAVAENRAFAADPDDSAPLVTRTYDLSDILEARSTLSPIIEFAPATGISLPKPEEAGLPQAMLQDIASKIPPTIEYSTWKTVPPIRIAGSSLIITQTEAIQQKIGSLIKQLREGQSVGVSIQYKLLVVKRGDLKPGAKRLALTAARLNKSPGCLSDNEVDSLIESIRNDKGITVFQSALDVKNGTGAYAQQCTGVSYVFGVDASKSGAQTVYNPRSTQLLLGMLVDLQRALVSADRQYVTMDFSVVWSHLRSLETVVVPADQNLNYQRPQVNSMEIRTRVTVPSDQWLLTSALIFDGSKNPAPNLDAPAMYFLVKPSVVDLTQQQDQ